MVLRPLWVQTCRRTQRDQRPVKTGLLPLKKARLTSRLRGGAFGRVTGLRSGLLNLPARIRSDCCGFDKRDIEF
jgi:hypothetical protein